MQFLGIKWDNNSKKPCIRFKTKPNVSTEEYAEIQYLKNLSISIHDQRYCIGHMGGENGSKANCPDNADMRGSQSAQCAQCRAKDATHFMPITTLSAAQKEELKQCRYYNYINIFGNDFIKIGVASESRKFTRLLEQGATASIIFASGDGYDTRVMEDYLSRALKLPQAISWAKKVGMLFATLSESEAMTKLRACQKDIQEIMGKHFAGNVEPIDEYYFHLQRYGLPLSEKTKSIYYLDEIGPGEEIGGMIVGVYGEIMIFERDADSVFALNTKQMLGYSIEISEELPKASDGRDLFGKCKIINKQTDHPPEPYSLFG